MCDPVSLTAAAAMAAGSVMQARAASAQAKARGQAIDAQTFQRQAIRTAENERQDALTRRSGAIANQAIQESGGEGLAPKIEQATQQRAANYERATPGADPGRDYLPMVADAPQVVKDAQSNALMEALKIARQRQLARSAIEGFGDAVGDSRIMLGRSGQDIAANRNFAGGSARVAGIENSAANDTLQAGLARAESAGSGARTAGTVLTGVGQIGLGYGLSGKGPGWAELFGGAPARAYSTAYSIPGRGPSIQAM